MAPRPIIIDTDPGQDDAVAILMALASPELDVVGITTVAGNVPQPLVTENALKMCELAGRPEVPVHVGAEGPLERPLVTAEYVHGQSGIDGAGLPTPQISAREGSAIDFIIETCLAAPDTSITLCPVGPLTNIALALRTEPRVAPKIREIALMGGGFFAGGNTTPVAEFNIYVDPQAAGIVFSAGVPVTMFPLDVTHQALALPAHIAELWRLGTTVGDAVAGMLDYFGEYDIEKYGMAGAPLHDPCVIAYLLEPDLFSGKDCHVEVETESELTIGQTVVDWWGLTGKPANATVMNAVDGDRFMALVIDRIGRL
jgi:purine nucleosidase